MAGTFSVLPPCPSCCRTWWNKLSGREWYRCEGCGYAISTPELINLGAREQMEQSDKPKGEN